MSKKTTTRFIVGIIMMNIFVGIALFCNRPERHEIGYEKIIQEAERQSEGVNSPNHNPGQEDRTLVGL